MKPSRRCLSEGRSPTDWPTAGRCPYCTLTNCKFSASDVTDPYSEPWDSGSLVATAATVLASAATTAASAAMDEAAVIAAAFVVAAFAVMNAATAAAAAVAVVVAAAVGVGCLNSAIQML